MKQLHAFLAASAVLLALMAPAGRAAAQAGAKPEPYKLAAGDTLGVRIAGEPELSGNFPINNAGEIVLPLVGPIAVADMTIADCQEAIRTFLARGILNQPVVTAHVEVYRPISLMGDVRSPGIYPYVSGRIVRMAVAQAGGYGLPGQSSAELANASERLEVLAVTHDRLVARQARLEAQLADRQSYTAPQLGLTSEATAAGLIEAEKAMFRAQTDAHRAQTRLLEAQRPQLAAEEESIEGQIASETQQVALLQKRITEYEKLDTKGLSRSRDLTELRLALATKEGNAWALKAQRSRTAIARMDLGNKIQELGIQYKARLANELEETRRQLLELSITLPSARTLMARRNQVPGGAADGSRSTHSVLIIRHQGSRRSVFEANEFTLLEPGDHVEIRMPLQSSTQLPAPSFASARPGP